ncbi:hypothetical protein LCGC14_1400520 [marine sediment metagenome]|uniref:Uncharacterized protein n=1 Tax=marine sediment metagenome TaxID=412755 RepID=A0A0F9KI61_9ZZZZ
MAAIDIGTDANSTVFGITPNLGYKTIYFEVASGTDVNSDDTLVFSEYEEVKFGMAYATNSNQSDLLAVIPAGGVGVDTNVAVLKNIFDASATGNHSGGIHGWAIVKE